MDWEETDKAICTKINDYSGTKVWPLQDKPAAGTWIEVHFLDRNSNFGRRAGKQNGYCLFQVSIFSLVQDLYQAGKVLHDLEQVLNQANFKSLHYQIRCGALQSTQVNQARSDELKGLTHVAVTMTATIWEL